MKTLTFLLMLLQQTVAPETPVRVPELGPAIRQSVRTTPAENPVMREGIALYDQGKIDEAMTRFDQILKASPNNTGAMLEMAQSYHQKHQYQMAMDLAAKGTNYISPELPQFYSLIGTILDTVGQPQKAIEAYSKGIALNTPNAGILYLNMGVTYQSGLKDFASAKKTFKQGALADVNYPGLHFQLGNLYLAQGLMTPVFLASTRFLVLEPNTARTPRVYSSWRATLDSKALPVVPPGNALYDYIHSPQQTGEGDLAPLDAALVTSKAAAAGIGKSQIELLVDQVDNLFGAYAKMQPGNDKEAFIWKYYIPYVVEMKQRSFVEPFVYYVNQGPNLPGVREWLTANPDRVNTFLLWSRTYRWPDPNSVDTSR